MSNISKLLVKMSNNPKSDWVIDDLVSVANKLGLIPRKPSGGSHYVFSSEFLDEHLTVPAHRPIKPIYIKKFVIMCELHIKFKNKGQNP